MWGSSLKYVSNNSNIKDKGQLRLLKNAKKKKVVWKLLLVLLDMMMRVWL